MRVLPQSARTWPALGEPVTLAEIDLSALRTDRPPELDAAVETRIVTKGRLGGVLVFFEADLAPGVVLSTNPATVDQSNHWSRALWLLPEPRTLESGTALGLRFGYRSGRSDVALTVGEAAAEGEDPS